MSKSFNVRIKNSVNVTYPQDLLDELPITQQQEDVVIKTREHIHNIMHKGEPRDNRMLVIVGPCSVHNPKSALEYAKKIASVQDKYKDDLLLVMRVYFEKPRTTVGWKGLINDPDLNNGFDVNKGLKIARQLLLDINACGVPCGTEFLDLISPQYVSDLISWGAIGARTTESQGHRELASGLSCPIGFKNGTSGNVQVAVDAIYAATKSHRFLGVEPKGSLALFETRGNEDTHIILRGGGGRPNYYVEDIDSVVEKLNKAAVIPKIMIDASHANSSKDYKKQIRVVKSIAEQVHDGNVDIFGAMIESNLVEGAQNFDVNNLEALVYGQSITDSCINWDTTIECLDFLASAVRERRKFLG